MKKVIFFNIIITLALFPYLMARWMHFPYSEGTWSLEIFMLYGTFLMGMGLSVSNFLMLITYKWIKYRPHLLQVSMLFLAALFFYPIYAGLLTGYDNGGIIADFIALAVLYGNLWLSNREFQKLRT